MSSFIPNILVSGFQSAREYLTPVLTTSQFYEKGQLTPDEFVAAGDYLVRLSPSWTWARGDASRAKSYLPLDKQFLLYKHAPCRRRSAAASATAALDDHNIISMFASEHVLPCLPQSPTSIADETDDAVAVGTAAVGTAAVGAAAVGPVSTTTDPDDEYGDMSGFTESALDVYDSSADSGKAVNAGTEDDIRLYDITIVYDNYYRTPRVYLCGFTHDGRPLSTNETMEDIMQDYINKTATIETHPHTGLMHISIHPCRHADTMKRILDVMISNNGGRLPSINIYMFLFIKFIGSMIPTIEYDNTMPVSI
jgi:ubiquitin-like-conjugating enzyme ATG3